MEVEQVWCTELRCPHFNKDCNYDHKTVCSRYVELLNQQNKVDVSISTHATSDVLLKIMNKCIQRGTDQRTVGHYVITSGEMSRMVQGEEIHILSNEYMNYDYTPVSSLAIALNTQKGIHYYYYGTKDQEMVILSLKERVKDYYQKGWRAKNRIVRWIRKAKSSIYNYQNFLISLCGYSIGNIVKSVIIGSNIPEEDKDKILTTILDNIKKKGKDPEHKMPNLANLKIVLDWIEGVGKSQDDEDVYKFIDEIGILIYSINDDENLMKDVFIKDFCNKIQLLLDMKEFAIWQIQSGYKIDPNRIEYLFSVFQYKDSNEVNDKFNELISAPMREWLKPAEGETDSGMVHCDESEMNAWADNIHFCVLNDENPFTLCYSFTLFIGEEGQAAAWYTTYKDNTSGNDSALDNQLLMIDIHRGDPLLSEIEKAFKMIITSDIAVKKILTDSGSRIIKFLRID